MLLCWSAFAMCKKLGQINYNATNAKDGNTNFAPFEGGDEQQMEGSSLEIPKRA